MNSLRLPFQLEAECAETSARAGIFQTLHGEVRTPTFMPVGTRATVKAQLTQTLEDSGAQVLLANTYHLLLRPGAEVFQRFGGIHRFMTWDRAVLTDSGGYQIFSLNEARSMQEAGAVFKSPLDGQNILLSPEVSIATQLAIGSDIMMALDQCIPSTAEHAVAEEALERTQRWAERSLAARGDSPQALFGIVQGALFPDLRKRSAEGLTRLGFDGFALGGLAVGESKQEREDVCAFAAPLLPRDRPRYLMGVGTPLDLLEAVHRGLDMFDCIMPTQVAQRGGAFTSRGFLQLRRGVYKFAEEPLDPACRCPTCRRYSRAYLSHLTKAKETLGWQLLGQHNLHFYQQLMRDIRASILAGTFSALYRERREYLHASDLDHPTDPKGHLQKPKGPPRTLGAYEVRVAPQGFSSILHSASGEVLCSRNLPMEEAGRLLIKQSRLADRLGEAASHAPARPLVLWDVGLGAAANAMAAVLCYEAAARQGGQGDVCPLRILSFENDLDPLRLALLHHDAFSYLRHGGPVALLEKQRWHSRKLPGLSWELVPGVFTETSRTVSEPPDLVFYDLFSLGNGGGAWSLKAFELLFSICAQHPTELFTSNCSYAVQAALLGAGFFVALGLPVAGNNETTIALTPAAAARNKHRLLDRTWLEQWMRSDARYPSDVAPEQAAAFDQRMLSHPQFRGAAGFQDHRAECLGRESAAKHVL
jgi:queuine tRNA-ribosyltransferase